MSTVRVTCPECDFTFSIADSRVGGLITCRDCKAEFRVEFAEDEADERDEPTRRDDRPRSKPESTSRTKSRMDADHEPEGWKTDLPLRSPVPLLIFLVGLQVLVAAFLALNWLAPVASPSASPSFSTVPNRPTTPKPAGFTPTSGKW